MDLIHNVKGNDVMYVCIFLISVYLLGAIPFGLLLSRWAGRDIRKEGSCNIGATNVLRVCGWKWGIPALALDMAKGAAPVLFINSGILSVEECSRELLSAMTGFAAILGHTFPIYLKFRGGKGVATSGGVLLALMPEVTLLALLVFVVIVVLCRFVSVGSTMAGFTIVIGHHLLGKDIYGATFPITVVAWLILILVIFCHRSNYIRLIRGTENQIGKIKSNPAKDTPDNVN